MTAEGQLQELRASHIWTVTLPASCTISITAEREKNVQSPDTLESQDTKIFLKKENLIPNMPSILKSSKLEVTLTVGKYLGQILYQAMGFIYLILAAPHSSEILVPNPGTEPGPSAVKHGVLTTRPPGVP